MINVTSPIFKQFANNLDQYTQKWKDKRQKQKQSYNERKKNSNKNISLFKITCLNRECSDCGSKLLNLLTDEKSWNDEFSVNWERYEYVTLKVKGDKSRRKLQLIKKKTSPHEMYEYIFDLLRVYPSRQFRAVWQNKQYE